MTFQKGHAPWNKGIKKRTNTGRTHFKKGEGFWTGKKRPNMSGKNHPRWNEGNKIISHGYIFVLKHNHPFADKIGYVPEHRLVMEKHLGRYLLPTERIHHINGIKTDNRFKNLKLCGNKSEHSKIHFPKGSKFGANK